MKKLMTFEQFISEDAINANPESEVVIDDMITNDGTEISSEEILGIIVSSDNEEQAVDKMYDKFGQTTFSEEDIATIKKYWNDLSAEEKEAEKEAEKDAEAAGTDTTDGEEDPLADL